MRVLWLALIVAALAAPGPARAQLIQGPITKHKAADRQKEAEKKKRTEEIDQAYQATTGGAAGQPQKPRDPWANMR